MSCGEVELFSTHAMALLLGNHFDINLSDRCSWPQKQKCACERAMKPFCVQVWIQLNAFHARVCAGKFKFDKTFSEFTGLPLESTDQFMYILVCIHCFAFFMLNPSMIIKTQLTLSKWMSSADDTSKFLNFFQKKTKTWNSNFDYHVWIYVKNALKWVQTSLVLVQWFLR